MGLSFGHLFLILWVALMVGVGTMYLLESIPAFRPKRKMTPLSWAFDREVPEFGTKEDTMDHPYTDAELEDFLAADLEVEFAEEHPDTIMYVQDRMGRPSQMDILLMLDTNQRPVNFLRDAFLIVARHPTGRYEFQLDPTVGWHQTAVSDILH